MLVAWVDADTCEEKQGEQDIRREQFTFIHHIYHNCSCLSASPSPVSFFSCHVTRDRPIEHAPTKFEDCRPRRLDI